MFLRPKIPPFNQVPQGPAMAHPRHMNPPEGTCASFLRIPIHPVSLQSIFHGIFPHPLFSDPWKDGILKPTCTVDLDGKLVGKIYLYQYHFTGEQVYAGIYRHAIHALQDTCTILKANTEPEHDDFNYWKESPGFGMILQNIAPTSPQVVSHTSIFFLTPPQPGEGPSSLPRVFHEGPSFRVNPPSELVEGRRGHAMPGSLQGQRRPSAVEAGFGRSVPEELKRLPSWKLTYPIPFGTFEDDFPFLRWDMLYNSLEGIVWFFP